MRMSDTPPQIPGFDMSSFEDIGPKLDAAFKAGDYILIEETLRNMSAVLGTFADMMKPAADLQRQGLMPGSPPPEPNRSQRRGTTHHPRRR